MGDNVTITINEKQKFTGRLIGLVTKEECRAIVKTKDAARKIFSAESVSVLHIGNIIKDRRFVVATSNYSENQTREIFISPTIRFLSYKYGKKTFKCEDDNEYTLEEL